MFPTINIEVDASAADAGLAKLESKLGDMSGAFARLRDEVATDVRKLFKEDGSGRMHPWAGWSNWTISWRALPLSAATSGTGHPMSYYGKRPAGSGGNGIGDWSGEMREGFGGKGPLGHSKIGSTSLEMGITTPAPVKADVFVKGRKGKNALGTSFWSIANRLAAGLPASVGLRGWKVHPQPARAVYENLDLSSRKNDNPIFRAFDWFFKP
jgi:hypothetical protein